MQEQPELGMTHERPTTRNDKEKVYRLAVESVQLEDQVGQLCAGEELRAEGRPKQMGRTLKDVTADVDSKTELEGAGRIHGACAGSAADAAAGIIGQAIDPWTNARAGSETGWLDDTSFSTERACS